MEKADGDLASDQEMLDVCAEIASLIQTKNDDVSFLRLPETTEPKNLAFLSAVIRPSVARADLILTTPGWTLTKLPYLYRSPYIRKVFIGGQGYHNQDCCDL